MSKDKNSTFDPPWFLVVVMLGAFWPVGLYFLFSKIKNIGGTLNIKKRNRRLSNGAISMALVGLMFCMNDSEVFGPFLLLGGVALFLYDRYLKKQDQKFLRYHAVVGERPVMSIKEIAGAMGVSYGDAVKDLQAMLDEKSLPEGAYLDLAKRLYLRDASFAPREEAPPRPQEQPKDKAQAQPQPKPKQEESEYLQKIIQIREVNEAIKNEKVSGQIERIEQITGNIFEIVVEHPEKRSQINTFMNYYLPTTLKLLSTYARLEKQGVAGDNIETSKRNIEKLLDQLVWAFEQQNDQMFARDAIDINSDIKVMQTMMDRDGLRETSLPKHPFAAATQKRGE